MQRRFFEADVFATTPFSGDPLAVIADADDLTGEQMQLIARWFGLSETMFLLSPTTTGVDYRVRIFTQTEELPFAGHPTLGTAGAWLLPLPREHGRGSFPAESWQRPSRSGGVAAR